MSDDRKTEFLEWLNRVAEEAGDWETSFPSYDRDPEGTGHILAAWAANIGDAMWRAESAILGESDESPYIYLCKCQPVGDNRVGRRA